MIRLVKARGLAVLLSVMLIMAVAGCSDSAPATTENKTQTAEYTLSLSGQVEKAGVISYAGLEMNVYADQASNPCGDCADQPVSVLAGATAQEVVQAIAKAIDRADDIWVVKEARGETIVLVEKVPGRTTEPAAPSAPAGLKIKGEYRLTDAEKSACCQ